VSKYLTQLRLDDHQWSTHGSVRLWAIALLGILCRLGTTARHTLPGPAPRQSELGHQRSKGMIMRLRQRPEPIAGFASPFELHGFSQNVIEESSQRIATHIVAKICALDQMPDRFCKTAWYYIFAYTFSHMISQELLAGQEGLAELSLFLSLSLSGQHFFCHAIFRVEFKVQRRFAKERGVTTALCSDTCKCTHGSECRNVHMAATADSNSRCTNL